MIKNLFFASLILKILFIFIFPIQADELVYYSWSENLDFGYFDHPPMTAYTLYLTHWLKQIHPHLIRLPGLILSHLAALIWIKVLDNYFKTSDLVVFACLILFSPLTGWGQLIMTPDVPLLFFVPFCFYYFWQSLNYPSAKNYLLFGVFLGLAFLSKYTAVLLPLAAMVYLTLSSSWKKVSFKLVPLTLIGGLICISPVIYWNIVHDWISFNFQLTHGFQGNAHQISVKKYILEQIGLISPFLVYLLFTRGGSLVFKSFAFTGLVFFLYSSFKARAEANWPLISYPFAYALISEKIKPTAKLFKSNMTLWLTAIFLVLGSILIKLPKLQNTKIYEAYNYMKLAPLAEKYSPLFATNAQMTSSINFVSKIKIQKLKEASRLDSFDFFDHKNFAKHFFYINKKNQPLPEWINLGHPPQLLLREALPNDYELLEVTLP